VSQGKGPPHGPQLPRWLFLSPEERETSPIWRALRDMDESRAAIQKHLPQYTPEQLERLRALLTQPKLPADVAESARRFREWWQDQEQALAATQVPAQPVEQPTEQPPRPGRPRTELHHLGTALDSLGKRWPKARSPRSQITKRHIKFVADVCRRSGDKIGRVYDDDWKVLDQALEQTIRRRIKNWKTSPT